MTKKQAITVIIRCAELYQENLENRQVAFVYRDADNHSEYVEVIFRSYNFLHFTGVIPRKGISANDFYRFALHRRLSEKDFSFRDPHTAMLKLQILEIIMKIDIKARMIGNYAGPHLELYTEKVTGTTTACLGLIHKNGSYIPNSVIKEDIRTIIPKPPGKIYVVFKKKIGDSIYTDITFMSKNIKVTKKCLPGELLHKISPTLLENTEEQNNV